jgi:hypothetical protein
MNKPISIALLVGGVIALIYGVAASESIGSSFSRLFTGSPTEKTMWLLISGGIATALGAAGLFRGTKAS